MPAGGVVYGRFAFQGIAIASTAVPLALLAFIAPVHALAPVASDTPALSTVPEVVLLPGVGFALSCMPGFECVGRCEPLARTSTA